MKNVTTGRGFITMTLDSIIRCNGKQINVCGSSITLITKNITLLLYGVIYYVKYNTNEIE